VQRWRSTSLPCPAHRCPWFSGVRQIEAKCMFRWRAGPLVGFLPKFSPAGESDAETLRLRTRGVRGSEGHQGHRGVTVVQRSTVYYVQYCTCPASPAMPPSHASLAPLPKRQKALSVEPLCGTLPMCVGSSSPQSVSHIFACALDDPRSDAEGRQALELRRNWTR
jgi:hypothetical protein